MKTALDYPTSLGYNATDAPYSPAAPHRGIDYAAPNGALIVIGQTIIGEVGATGAAMGPHVHVQAGRDEWAQKPINPAPYVGALGTVVKVSEASQWGKYVCIKVGDVYVYYCHMRSQSVQVGETTKGGDMAEKSNMETARQIGYSMLGLDGRDGRPNALLGGREDDLRKYHKDAELTVGYLNTVFDSPEAESYRQSIDAVYAERDALRKQLASIKPGQAEAKLAAIKEALGIEG